MTGREKIEALVRERFLELPDSAFTPYRIEFCVEVVKGEDGKYRLKETPPVHEKWHSPDLKD